MTLHLKGIFIFIQRIFLCETHPHFEMSPLVKKDFFIR